MNDREPSGLGLWQVSTVAPRRALDAMEEALGPVLGVPGCGVDDWVSGVQAITTVPLDANAEPSADLPWRFEALCANAPESGDIIRALAPVARAFGFEVGDIDIEEVHAIDWVKAALASHPPVRAGRFYVHGTHEEALPRGFAVDLRVDAGRAFGTGNHQTTQCCLRAIDDLARERKFTNLLDVGAGSGILSLAMAALWRVPVLGIDTDPMAARIAEDYARRNGLANLTRFLAGDGLNDNLIRSSAPYDLITANILARPLKRLAPDIRRALKPGGRLILSGILDRHEQLVLSAYRTQGMYLVRRYRMQEWSTLVLAR